MSVVLKRPPGWAPGYYVGHYCARGDRPHALCAAEFVDRATGELVRCACPCHLPAPARGMVALVVVMTG